MKNDLKNDLAKKGYWPAIAAGYLANKEYSRTVELCLLRLKDEPEIVSGRLMLARALFHSGQYDDAENHFYEILRNDPDNLVALKYLGDLKYKDGDEATAVTYYRKIMSIEPKTTALHSQLESKEKTETKVLNLVRGAEESKSETIDTSGLAFKTETMGDLLLKQGHSRLALEIFRELAEKNGNSRIKEKLEKTREAIKAGKNKNV